MFIGKLPLEIFRKLCSLHELRELVGAIPELTSPSDIQRRGEAIIANGFEDRFHGTFYSPPSIQSGSGFREGVVADGINCRARSIMYLVSQIVEETGITSPTIFIAEARTPLAAHIIQRYPDTYASEFAPTEEAKRFIFPTPHQDLCDLYLPNDKFDLVITSDVLEHVYDFKKAFREIHRVLKPGGYHISAVPFRYFDEDNQLRCSLDGSGQVVHHMLPAEYHGNHISDVGSLVYLLPGWEVINTAKECWFSDAYMWFGASDRYGIVAEHISGIFLLVTIK